MWISCQLNHNSILRDRLAEVEYLQAIEQITQEPQMPCKSKGNTP
jgi:hypothetical protein